MLDPALDSVEQRVLGCLVEKQLSTPDYYPLTLNALVNACNQSTNRDPVMELDEGAVARALEGLRERKAVWYVDAAGSRVRKYEHRLSELLSLSIQETAILAELLLRGPQTPGELRNRCGRMYAFQDLQEAETALGVMQEADPPLVARLPRAPGTKESRFAHQLGGQEAQPLPAPRSSLEAELAALKEEHLKLRSEFEAFRKQFE